jgi:hypothetical protein
MLGGGEPGLSAAGGAMRQDGAERGAPVEGRDERTARACSAAAGFVMIDLRARARHQAERT